LISDNIQRYKYEIERHLI